MKASYKNISNILIITKVTRKRSKAKANILLFKAGHATAAQLHLLIYILQASEARRRIQIRLQRRRAEKNGWWAGGRS